MKNVLKKLGLFLLIALVVLQFFRPDGNANPVVAANQLNSKFPLSPDVKTILTTSCFDCHSNNSAPMWYMQIQPVGMWIDHHIEEAKGELNFDEFGTYSLRRQYHKFEEIEEMLTEDEMPLTSYTIIHGDASLSDAQKKTLVDWTKAMRDTMEAHYPMDSLIRKK